jgi:hypothetical protein
MLPSAAIADQFDQRSTSIASTGPRDGPLSPPADSGFEDEAKSV